MTKKRVLTEASGSLTAGYLIKAIQDAGHVAVASDIDDQCAGRYLANDFMVVPAQDDPNLWESMSTLLKANRIDVVIPSLDETLEGWAARKNVFKNSGIEVIVSDEETVQICQDKWKTFLFFKEHGIPTPETSLNQEFELVKPRQGRGGAGVERTKDTVDMVGMISQEYLEGEEYTIDVLCDKEGHPCSVIPRKRDRVLSGKSIGGTVVQHQDIETWVNKICSSAHFQGPINIQCFVEPKGTIKFTEINPRIAGGMALSFAASRNWIELSINHFLHDCPVNVGPVQYGMQMKRYYAEVFVSSN